MEFRKIDLEKEKEPFERLIKEYFAEFETNDRLFRFDAPFGFKTNPSLTVDYVGAYEAEELAGMAGHTYVPKLFEPHLFEIMLVTASRFRGKGVATELWRELVRMKGDRPLLVANNTEGGARSLEKAAELEERTIHYITVVE